MEFKYQRRSEAERDERNRKIKDRRDRAGILGLWAAALVGCVAIIASCVDSERQLRAISAQIVQMQAQAGEMQAQIGEMQAEQRPWVSMTKDSSLELMFIDHVNNEIDARFKFPLRNTGKNPATAVYATGQVGFIEQIPYGSLQAWQQAVCRGADTALGIHMFPGSVEPVYDLTVSGKWPTRNNIVGSTPLPMAVPYIVTCIGYTDAVSHIRHYTPMIFRVLELSAKGQPCCAVFLKHLPEEGKKLAFQEWLIGNLPPT